MSARSGTDVARMRAPNTARLTAPEAADPLWRTCAADLAGHDCCERWPPRSFRTCSGSWRWLRFVATVDVHQVMADFMGVAADDLQRAERPELRMADLGF